MHKLLLKLAADGENLSLITGNSLEIARKSLYKAGLSEYFNSFYGIENLVKGKPSPEGLKKAMEVSRVSSEQTRYVGDTPLDAKFAKAAGSKICLLYTGLYSRTDLEEENPDYIAENASEVYDFLVATR